MEALKTFFPVLLTGKLRSIEWVGVRDKGVNPPKKEERERENQEAITENPHPNPNSPLLSFFYLLRCSYFRENRKRGKKKKKKKAFLRGVLACKEAELPTYTTFYLGCSPTLFFLSPHTWES